MNNGTRERAVASEISPCAKRKFSYVSHQNFLDFDDIHYI